MARVEFARQSSRDPANPQATAERLVNLYPEPMPPGARAQFALKSVPGTTTLATVPGVFVRAMINATAYDSEGIPSDRLVAVSDATLRRVDADGTVETIGAIVEDENTALSTNNGAITVVAGGRYWVWNAGALTEPTPGVFSNFGAVEFIGDYTVLTERNDRRFCWSDLTDATTLPALNFATAEARDDVILRPVSIAGNLWLFKTTSIEIWGATGLAGASAFSRVGPVIETGLLGFRLVAKIPGGAFFVGDDGIAYVTGGAPALQPVSTPAVNEHIRGGEPTGCFYYEHAGHKFCVIGFRDRPALVYDLATGAWHERATGDGNAWGATGAARAYGAWRLSGFNGEVRTAVDVASDSGATLFRRAVSSPLEMGGERFRVLSVNVLGEVGQSNIGRDALVQMRISRDGGLTWGQWRSASLGNLGGYTRRAVFRACGMSRVFTVELRLTDPTDLTLWSAADVVAA